MGDPSYQEGVTSKSVVNMVTDMSQVLLGKSNYVTAPSPLYAVGPVTHIAFKDNSSVIPEDVNVRPLQVTNKGTSRRSQSYNIAQGELNPIPSDPQTRCVTMDIDEAMEFFNKPDTSNHNEKDTEDDVESIQEDVPVPKATSARVASKKPADVVVGRPASRRIVARSAMQS